MNFREMLQALLDGHGVRRSDWMLEDTYIELEDGRPMQIQGDKGSILYTFDRLDMDSTSWEIYTPPEEKTAYYRWRLWMPSGSIVDIAVLCDEEGRDGTGCLSINWEKAIKRQKISEAIYKVDGQA